MSEKLYFYPKTQKALLFSRSNNQKFSFGTYFTGEKQFIVQSLLPNQLFLSKCSMYNVPLLNQIYKYLENNLQVFFKEIEFVKIMNLFKLPFGSGLFDIVYQIYLPQEIATKIKKTDFAQKLNLLIETFDVGVTQIYGKPKKNANFLEQMLNMEFDIVSNHRSREKNNIEFNLQQESTGTQWLFILGALILEALESGSVLFIDEFEKNLHPHITQFIVELFRSKEFNKNNAQLVFATHDVTLMNSENLSRSEIYLVEKNEYGESELFALSDFEGIRANTPFDKWYLGGKFGAIPQINYAKFYEIFK